MALDREQVDPVRAKLKSISGVIDLIRRESNALKVINILRQIDPTLSRAEAGRQVSNAWRIKRAVDDTTNRPSGPSPKPTAVPIVKIPNPPGPGRHPVVYDIEVVIRSPYVNPDTGKQGERRPRWKIVSDKPLTSDEILKRVKDELAETYQSRAHDEWLKRNPGEPLVSIVIRSFIRI